QVDDIGQRDVYRSIAMHTVEIGKPGKEVLAKVTDSALFGVAFGAGQGESFAHPYDLMGRQGAGAHATLVTATMDQRLETDVWAAPHIECADPLGTVELMRRQR